MQVKLGFVYKVLFILIVFFFSLTLGLVSYMELRYSSDIDIFGYSKRCFINKKEDGVITIFWKKNIAGITGECEVGGRFH